MNSSNSKLSGFPEWFILPETTKVMDASNSNGCAARFVGGCVRDVLVNKKSTDIDIAVNFNPYDVVSILNEFGIKSVPTGIEHGTVTAIVNGISFQITSLRKDIENFGRHAKVEFTNDWEEDAKRRDFTINAIYADMQGNLFDYFGGIEDLRIGRVRFVGNAQDRVKEDYLRILRFFRFYAHFGKGEPDTEALEACSQFSAELKNISRERIGVEILKILESDNPARVWRLMEDTGVSQEVLPEAKNIEALDKLIKLEKKFETKLPAVRRLAVLIDDVSEVENRLRLSKNQIKDILLMMKECELDSEIKIKKTVYKYGNDICRGLVLLDAVRKEESENLKSFYEVATGFRAPRFPVNGDDVIEAGISEGAEVGKILEKLESWWIENDFSPKRSDCLTMLRKATEQ